MKCPSLWDWASEPKTSPKSLLPNWGCRGGSVRLVWGYSNAGLCHPSALWANLTLTSLKPIWFTLTRPLTKVAIIVKYVVILVPTVRFFPSPYSLLFSVHCSLDYAYFYALHVDLNWQLGSNSDTVIWRTHTHTHTYLLFPLLVSEEDWGRVFTMQRWFSLEDTDILNWML